MDKLEKKKNKKPDQKVNSESEDSDTSDEPQKQPDWMKLIEKAKEKGKEFEQKQQGKK